MLYWPRFIGGVSRITGHRTVFYFVERKGLIRLLLFAAFLPSQKGVYIIPLYASGDAINQCHSDSIERGRGYEVGAATRWA